MSKNSGHLKSIRDRLEELIKQRNISVKNMDNRAGMAQQQIFQLQRQMQAAHAQAAANHTHTTGLGAQHTHGGVGFHGRTPQPNGLERAKIKAKIRSKLGLI